MSGEAFNELGLGVPEAYEAVFEDIRSGTILSAKAKKLADHARTLASYHVDHAGQDEFAAALLIHNLHLARNSKRLERLTLGIGILTAILTVLTIKLCFFPS